MGTSSNAAYDAYNMSEGFDISMDDTGTVEVDVSQAVGATVSGGRTDSGTLREIAECLRVLAHPQRLALVEAILESERTVGELADLVDIPPHVASAHLNLMRRCGILDVRREGRKAFYFVPRADVRQVLTLILKTGVGKRSPEQRSPLARMGV